MRPRYPRKPQTPSGIPDLEQQLIERYKLGSLENLYCALRQAHFHEKFSDPAEHWNATAYFCFSAEWAEHQLLASELQELRREFDAAILKHGEEFALLAFEEIAEGRNLRTQHAHFASAHRYACERADSWCPPCANFMALLIAHADQLGQLADDRAFEDTEVCRQFNAYLNYVQNVAEKLPVNKLCKLAAARQLADLEKSGHCL